MLRLQAALEEKLKNKGALGSTISKPDKAQKPLKLANGKLETFDDYVDDADNDEDDSHGLMSNMVSQIVSAKRKPKIVSGDGDLPKRDDIGERRRKFELRVLAGAGVKSEDGGGDEPMTDTSEDDDDGDDLYEQAKRRREAKLAAKAEMSARPMSANPSSFAGNRGWKASDFIPDGEEQRTDTKTQQGSQKPEKEVQEKARAKGKEKKRTGAGGEEAVGAIWRRNHWYQQRHQPQHQILTPIFPFWSNT